MITRENPADLHALCRTLADGAAEIATRRRRQGVSVAATKSSDVDIVTAVDQEVEQWLLDQLASARPDDAVLGEEGDGRTGTSGLTWVVDPIDGTVNYLYGLPHWSVSVAVCAGPPEPGAWELLAGAVAAPALGVTWHAVRGGGAFRGETRIEARAGVPLGKALVGTGFSYVAERRSRQGAAVAALLPQVRDIRRLGSVAIDLCLVADGSLDAHYERGLNVWDIAAGSLVLTESGGEVLGPGSAPAPDMIVAGHGHTVRELAAALAALVE
ncbi:MAG: inositol monophosphatase [Actinobacteria bacterium]|nr:inositol monophosphatase [Actinomycetota bacterium]